MTFYSPLRYPGGKFKLVEYFKNLINENGLNGGFYVEPYAGGASIALSILIEGYVSKVFINDYDISIYAFWHSVLYDTDKLCDLIEKTPINLEIWKKQKEIQNNKKKIDYTKKDDLLILGFSTFFLNRTNISGVITAGPIGGKSQESKWKIDCRYNKEKLINKIKFIASFKDKIKLYNEDALKLISRLKDELNNKTLFYLDPPYYVKGKELYFNHYNYEDHLAISNEVKNITKQMWVITYDDVDIVKQLYKKFNPKSFTLPYSAGKTQKGKELMIFSNNLTKHITF